AKPDALIAEHQAPFECQKVDAVCFTLCYFQWQLPLPIRQAVDWQPVHNSFPAPECQSKSRSNSSLTVRNPLGECAYGAQPRHAKQPAARINHSPVGDELFSRGGIGCEDARLSCQNRFTGASIFHAKIDGRERKPASRRTLRFRLRALGVRFLLCLGRLAVICFTCLPRTSR